MEILVCVKRVPDTSENEIEINSAGNDIERASDISRKMVCSWGMSKKMGPLAYGKKEEQVFLGKEIGHAKDYSETTAVTIDDEVKALVMDGYNRARQILEDNIDLLHGVAKLLLEKETIDGKEIDILMGIEPEEKEPAGTVDITIVDEEDGTE